MQYALSDKSTDMSIDKRQHKTNDEYKTLFIAECFEDYCNHIKKGAEDVLKLFEKHKVFSFLDRFYEIESSFTKEAVMKDIDNVILRSKVIYKRT